MKISHILSNVEITQLDAEQYLEDIMTAWTRLRFGGLSEAESMHAETIGQELLLSTNFMDLRSGLFDQQRVFFPVEGLPRVEKEIKGRLEWMVDCRTNPQTIYQLLRVLKDPFYGVQASLSDKQVTCSKLIAQTEILQVSKTIERMWTTNPSLAEALLSGRLGRIKEVVGEIAPVSRSSTARAIRCMYIIWSLFELQIISYRLFHAQWNVLEAGAVKHPTLMTMAGLEKLLKRFMHFATLAKTHFETKPDGTDPDPELAAFINEEDLEALAKRHCERMNTGRDGIPASTENKKMREYLDFLDSRSQLILNAFAQMHGTSSPILTNFQKSPNSTYKTKTSRSSNDMKRSLATERYAVPLLTCLCYAVIDVAGLIDVLPTDDEVILTGCFPPMPGHSTYSRSQKSSIIRHLIGIYRFLYVRDANSLTPEEREFYEDALGNIDVQRKGDQPLEPRSLESPNAAVYGAGLEVDQVLSSRAAGTIGHGMRPPNRSFMDARALIQIVEDQTTSIHADAARFDAEFSGQIYHR